MNDYIDFEDFPHGPEFYGDLDQNRVYLSTIYELLGLDNALTGSTYSNFYWDIDEERWKYNTLYLL